MRITTGMSSGTDYQAMVDSLMKVERTPIYRLDNEIYEYEQKQKAWNALDVSLTSLYTSTSNLNRYTEWQKMDISSADEDIVTATAKYTAKQASYDVTVNYLAEKHRIASDSQTDTSSALTLAGTFNINGEDITVDNTDSLNDIMDKINTASLNMADEDKVTATIIDTTLVIERNTTGNTDISLTDSGSDQVLKDLGLLTATNNIKNELQEAKDLSANINGIDISRSSNTGLTDVITDVTIDFSKTGTTTINVARDTDNILSMVQDFVEKYNASMEVADDYANSDVDEDGASNTGMLQGDSLLRNIMFKSRQLVTAYDDTGTLDTSFNRLSTIGITTSGQDNKLTLDTAKFEDALKNNFSEVEDLFRDYDKGVIHNFSSYLDSLTSVMDGSIDTRVANIDTKIEDNVDKIGDIERRLVSYEDQLWLQFSRMEEALANMQQQTSFLGGMLGTTN